MYRGITGALKFISSLGEVPIAYISGWNVEDKTEMLESSTFTSIDKETLPGFKSWSASANGAVSFEAVGGHDVLFSKYYKGEKIAFYFYLNDVENTYFRGDGYVESLSVDLAAEDKGNISISVAGTGSLELYVGGKNVINNAEYAATKTLKFTVGDNGHLLAEVPDAFADAIWLENGRLAVKLI